MRPTFSVDAVRSVRQDQRVMTSAEQQRFEVLLERIDAKVNAIAEGQEATNDGMHRVETKVDGLAEEVALVKMDVGAMKGRLGRIEVDVGAMKGRLDAIETDVGTVKGRLGR